MTHCIRLCAVLIAFLWTAPSLGFKPDARLVDPIATLSARDLPQEAKDTLALIKKGGPFPYSKDGATFGNREGLLPPRPRGHYREYTVKTPGVRNRGARRIVADGGTLFYYTEDHYQSFKRIQE